MSDDRAGILSRDALIGLKAYWRVKLFYWTGSNLDYICCHEKPDAATSDADWAIWKVTYTGSDITMIEGPLTGICDDRATLSWR